MSDAKPAKGKGRSATMGPPKMPVRALSGPEISIGEAPMGRSTLVEVEDELRAAPWPRPPLVTVSYDDVPLDGKKGKKAAVSSPRIIAPAVVMPPLRGPLTSAPEIEVHEAPLGRETMALIDGDDEPVTIKEPASDALELRTFVVPATSVSPRATDAEKRKFVRERLAHRLPCAVAEVRRIDARQIEPGAVMLRVWCPVD